VCGRSHRGRAPRRQRVTTRFAIEYSPDTWWAATGMSSAVQGGADGCDEADCGSCSVHMISVTPGSTQRCKVANDWAWSTSPYTGVNTIAPNRLRGQLIVAQFDRGYRIGTCQGLSQRVSPNLYSGRGERDCRFPRGTPNRCCAAVTRGMRRAVREQLRRDRRRVAAVDVTLLQRRNPCRAGRAAPRSLRDFARSTGAWRPS
jgi:hypothetical protein